MVQPTDAELQALLLLEIGDDGTVLAQMPVIWRLYEPYAGYYTADARVPLRYLYAKRKGIDVLIGSVRAKFSFAEKDRRVELKELLANLMLMREAATLEVEEATSILYNGASVSSVEQLDVVNMHESPDTQVDANSLRYSGDPNLFVWPEQER